MSIPLEIQGLLINFDFLQLIFFSGKPFIINAFMRWNKLLVWFGLVWTGSRDWCRFIKRKYDSILYLLLICWIWFSYAISEDFLLLKRLLACARLWPMNLHRFGVFVRGISTYSVEFPPKFDRRFWHCTFYIRGYCGLQHWSFNFAYISSQFVIVNFALQHWSFYFAYISSQFVIVNFAVQSIQFYVTRVPTGSNSGNLRPF